MAKRSPILGYNHNVRYRGLIFHVQTEDSGLLSPHLFTHLFHGGVILSTRKLVYDAGAAEDAIKGLMQAQHKVVLKDLKSGKFDDKIDQYLAGTEGLLPREAKAGEEAADRPSGELTPPPPDVPRESEPALQVRMSEPEISVLRAETGHDANPESTEDAPMRPAGARTSTPPPVPARASTPPPIRAATAPVAPTPAAAPTPARTKTAERKSAPTAVRTTLPASRPVAPPAPADLDPPTITESAESIAAAVAAANATVRNIAPPAMEAVPELSLELDLDDQPGSGRVRRDTMVEDPRSFSDGVPGAVGASASGRVSGDSIPPLPPPPGRQTADRGSAVGAAALPPGRPIASPSRQAMTPPAVMSRPLTSDDRSDAVEVYAPPPPSAEAPPGAASERPGAYAQHKRQSTRIPVPVDVVKNERERSGAVPIPAGLARPKPHSQSPGIPQRVGRDPSSGQARAGTASPGSGASSRSVLNCWITLCRWSAVRARDSALAAMSAMEAICSSVMAATSWVLAAACSETAAMLSR